MMLTRCRVGWQERLNFPQFVYPDNVAHMQNIRCLFDFAHASDVQSCHMSSSHPHAQRASIPAVQCSFLHQGRHQAALCRQPTSAVQHDASSSNDRPQQQMTHTSLPQAVAPHQLTSHHACPIAHHPTQPNSTPAFVTRCPLRCLPP